jgi:transcriptional regulator with XRE-family HTH domain
MSLKEIRERKGVTQKQLAMKMAMEQTTLSKKERGISPITSEEYKKLAGFLETVVEELQSETHPLSKNENCTFNDNSVGIQIISMPKDALDLILKLVSKLEEENADLKNQEL